MYTTHVDFCFIIYAVYIYIHEKHTYLPALPACLPTYSSSSAEVTDPTACTRNASRQTLKHTACPFAHFFQTPSLKTKS